MSLQATLMTLVYVLFPLACFVAVPQRSGAGSAAERTVYAVALYEFLLLVSGLVLGLTGNLSTTIYASTIGCATLLLGMPCLYKVQLPRPAGIARRARTLTGKAMILAVALVAVAFLLELGFDFLYGTRHGDGLWYHIPRVMIWLQQGNFKPWDTSSAPSIGLPAGADLILLHRILLGQGWAGAGYVTFVLTIGAVACVYLAGLELGLRRRQAAMAALLFATFPAAGLRIWSINSDMAAAFPALASFVALHRIRTIDVGFALFILLNAMALACKPTVAPPAFILACMTLWLCRHRLTGLQKKEAPCGAVILGAILIVASYWPVYSAFSDFTGGDYSRTHRSATIAEYLHGVAMHTGYWLLEPLGYLSHFKTTWEVEAVRSFYNILGANFASLPEQWKPYPGQDTGYTGLASLLVLPLLFTRLAPQVRGLILAAFILAYIPLSGMIHPQPYFVRYNLLLLAGLALLWCGSGLFSSTRWRHCITGITILNGAALVAVVVINIYMHRTKWSQPGGLYFYIQDMDRRTIAETLTGRPLLILTESEAVSSMDALLPGPDILFPLHYVICPPDGDWIPYLQAAAGKSNWLALIHNGGQTLTPGPVFKRPGSHICSQVSRRSLEESLRDAGWSLYRSNTIADLWRYP